MEVFTVILARGGSKSIPRKNLQLLAGEPLIAWTIETALASPSLGRVIVSTDDKEIADVARQYNAEVPFIRPPELAQDDTPGLLPVLHAINWVEEHEGYRPEYVVCLPPTAPLRTVEDVEGVVRLAVENDAEGVVSVTPVEHHPFWMKLIDSEGRMSDFLEQDRSFTRRQDLPPVYALNGSIYLARREVLLKRRTWYSERTYAYLIPSERSLDVDTPWDLYLADLVLRDRRDNAGGIKPLQPEPASRPLPHGRVASKTD